MQNRTRRPFHRRGRLAFARRTRVNYVRRRLSLSTQRSPLLVYKFKFVESNMLLRCVFFSLTSMFETDASGIFRCALAVNTVIKHFNVAI
jgi:hypothetical protein